jgi:CBS domain-containing protein
MRVSEVMASSVSCCDPSTDLEQVAHLMLNADCGSIPITDEVGRPVGIVTDRDIAMACALNHKSLWEMRGQDLLNGAKVFSCTSNDDIQTAINIMLREKVRRLPVVNDQGVVEGMLSVDDIVAMAERGRRGEGAPPLSYDDAMSALKAVSKHH